MNKKSLLKFTVFAIKQDMETSQALERNKKMITKKLNGTLGMFIGERIKKKLSRSALIILFR